MLGFMVVAVLVMRSFMGVGGCGHAITRAGDGDALEILRRRYAAGEVTPEQFEEMRCNLRR